MKKINGQEYYAKKNCKIILIRKFLNKSCWKCYINLMKKTKRKNIFEVLKYGRFL